MLGSKLAKSQENRPFRTITGPKNSLGATGFASVFPPWPLAAIALAEAVEQLLSPSIKVMMRNLSPTAESSNGNN
jgi:hypothetical protein